MLKEGAGAAASLFFASPYLASLFARRKERALLAVSPLVPTNKRHDDIGLSEEIVTVETDMCS